MKAVISELWNTGLEIVTTECEEGQEFPEREIESFQDLKSCENVLVGQKDKECPSTEIMLGDQILYVHFRTVSHPTDCGKLRICEVD